MHVRSILLIGLGFLPAAAFANEPDEKPPSTLRGAMEVTLGLGAAMAGIEGGQEKASVQATDSAYALTPMVEWPAGAAFYLGIEASFLSVDDPFGVGDRRSVVLPGGRARLSFELWDGFMLDGVFSVTGALWSSDGFSSLTGWGYRVAFGGAWQFRDTLWLYTQVGRQVVNAFTEEGGDGKAERDQPVVAAFTPLTVGVRAGW
jgi:hypothetical protein